MGKRKNTEDAIASTSSGNGDEQSSDDVSRWRTIAVEESNGERIWTC
jgi:hypothetical protein